MAGLSAPLAPPAHRHDLSAPLFLNAPKPTPEAHHRTPLLGWLPNVTVELALQNSIPEPIKEIRAESLILFSHIAKFHQGELRNRSGGDYERSQLIESCSYPLLSSAEEQLLGKAIDCYRTLFQMSLLKIPTIRNAIVQDLTRYCDGEPPRKLFYLNSTKQGEFQPEHRALIQQAVASMAKSEVGQIKTLLGINLRQSLYLEHLQNWSAIDTDISYRDRHWEERAREHLSYLDEASQNFQKCNARLVLSIAKRYRNRGVDITDLFQEGSLGLNRAVEQWDHERGLKFSTYATWWIRQAITHAFPRNADLIRIPPHQVSVIRHIQQSERELWNMNHCAPTPELIAEHSGIPLSEIQLLRNRKRPSSLDATLGENSETTRSELIADPRFSDPDALENRRATSEALNKAFAMLDPRERDIIKLRFGIGDGTLYSIEEVARIFDTSVSRIKQQESMALRKLRRESHLKEFAQVTEPI